MEYGGHARKGAGQRVRAGLPFSVVSERSDAPGDMHIRTLDTLEDVRELDDLLREYIQFVTDDLRRAHGVSFDADVLLANTRNSLHKVVPPHGVTLVAEADDGTRLGMGFLRPSGSDAMEIKRLYVPPRGRGQGAGKALVTHAIGIAQARGKIALRLDSTRNLETAIALYRKLGFEECAPYPESDHYDDPVLAPHMIFMEKRLESSAGP
ncbi:MAG: GNAT family N-acetyltransferase [Pseudomonadota bacterium]